MYASCVISKAIISMHSDHPRDRQIVIRSGSNQRADSLLCGLELTDEPVICGGVLKADIGSELLLGDCLSARATSSFRPFSCNVRQSDVLGTVAAPIPVKPFDECLTCRTLQKDGLGGWDGDGVSAW
jgi:hypothetical protein